MLAALEPSGTIHVGGSSSVNAGMLSTDFKMMKHNNSNHSIQSTKKMISTIRKPTDFLTNGALNNNNGGVMNPNLNGPVVNQLALSGKKNLQ